MKCPICGEKFTSYPDMRKDALGVFWCQPCTDEHDSIDWEVYERRLDDEGL